MQPLNHYQNQIISDIHEAREAQKGAPLKSLLYRIVPRLKEAIKWSPLSDSRLGAPWAHNLKHKTEIEKKMCNTNRV